MNELLELLREAQEQLMDMLRVADDSVADFILDIQTAISFINKALETEDRLDVFRALQKAHDVLEKEYDETPPDEEYDNLVDRIQQALGGLNEKVYMKESELKALIKAVLTEIYQEPEADKESGILGFFQHMADTMRQSRPELNDINKGHDMANKLISAMIADIKAIIKGALRKKDKEIGAGVDSFHHHSSSFIAFMVNWAQQIDSHAQGHREELNKPMNDLKDHLNQIGGQFGAVFSSIKDKTDSGKPNIINAMKQLEHLNEIFANLKASVDEVFRIGVESGYGKKK